MGSWVAKRVRASYSPVIPEPNHRPASREYLVACYFVVSTVVVVFDNFS